MLHLYVIGICVITWRKCRQIKTSKTAC